MHTRTVCIAGGALVSTVLLYVAVTSVAFFAFPITVRAIASVISGLLLVRLFILYHDAEHGAILHRSRWGAAFMTAYGLLTLNPPSIWNRSHDHHHKNNSKMFGAGIGSYPVMTTTGYAQASRGEKLAYRISRHPLNIACGYATIFLYGMCIRSLISSPRRHWDSGLSLLLHGSMAVGLAMLGWQTLTFTLLVPFAVACGLGAYLFYAQHNFPGVKIRERDEWNYVYAALHSSSYIRMNPVLAWFTGNIGYHHVHHLNSRIPFYRLPEAMQALSELQTPTTTSLSPVDIFRCLRLKLWDPEQDCMVSFAEARKIVAASQQPTHNILPTPVEAPVTPAPREAA